MQPASFFDIVCTFVQSFCQFTAVMSAYVLVKDSEGFCLYIILIRSSFGGGGGVLSF